MKKSPAEEKQGQSVEDIFRDGFAHVEPTPPTRVWENLDHILDNQELQHYRRQLVWYRSIAAAALLLLLSGALLLWQNGSFPLGQPENALATGPVKAAQTLREATTAGAPSPVTPAQEAPHHGLGAFPEKQPLLASATDQVTSLRRKRAFSSAPQTAGTAFGSRKTSTTTSEVQEKAGQLAMSTHGVVENEEATTAVSGTEEIQNGLALASTTGKKSPGTMEALDTLAGSRANTILRQKQTEPDLLTFGASAKKEADKPAAQEQRWSLAVAYSPQYAYSPVKLGQGPRAAPATFAQPEMARAYSQAVAEYNESYSPTYSYSTMVGASYKINEKWQIESGFLYTQNEAITHHSYMVSGNSASREMLNAGISLNVPKNIPLVTNALQADAAAAALSVSRTDEYNIKYKYQQVGVPLRVAYRHNIKKLFAFVSGGVNLNLLVQNSIEPETDQIEAVHYSFNDRDSPFNVWQWAAATSVGVGYDVSKNMSVIVAPELTYSLTPLVREQQPTEAYQLGVSIGGRWRLFK